MSDTNPEARSAYDLDIHELRHLLGLYGQPRYRADQVWQWLYRGLASDYAEMTNVPKELRSSLAATIPIPAPGIASTATSRNHDTRKDALALSDGARIEAVLMRYERRRTACISTQAGCAVGCAFCATGRMGLRRSLTTGEIVAQVIHIARVLEHEGQSLTNVVFMGMGEPFLNYDASLEAARRLTSAEGLRLGQRRVTISTVGIVPGIQRLAAEGLNVRLAVSLHAATDELRDRLVPINRRYPLGELLDACRAYTALTGRRVTFEWALIAGVNDSPDQARVLASRIEGLKAHVNLIPLNPVAGYDGRPSPARQVERFAAELERARIPHSIRARRGVDIRAGCGQLAVRE
jgi:23S rRNA (adenine2503-C2)-methyltransferase